MNQPNDDPDEAKDRKVNKIDPDKARKQYLKGKVELAKKNANTPIWKRNPHIIPSNIPKDIAQAEEELRKYNSVTPKPSNKYNK